MTVDHGSVEVTVCYAESDRAVVKSLRLAVPACVADVIRLAAADADFRGVDVERAAVGIFGRIASPSTALGPGDRVEFYRALAMDPKAARRARARSARST